MRGAAILVVLWATAACQGGDAGNRAELNRIAGVYQKGETRAAIEQLHPYLRQYPRDDLAWTILGNACEEEDRDMDAQKAYDTALSINPRRAQAHVGQGVLYRKQRRYDDAMSSYQAALEIEPRNAQAYSSMTTIALKRLQNAQALEYAKKGYELDPKDPVVAANLAVAYHYNGDVEGRDRLTNEAARLGYRLVDRLQRIYSGEITIVD